MDDIDEPSSMDAAKESETKDRSKRKRVQASGAHDPGVGTSRGIVQPRASGNNGTPPHEHTTALRSSSASDLLDSTISQGHGDEISRPSTPPVQPTSTNPQTQISDRKATAKEGFGVASRFAQTLLKKVPACVESNPVKMAFSIANVIIEIKEVLRRARPSNPSPPKRVDGCR
ncbi:unnamed protein product [Cyclocybe aegerita]|uniref:Uncharacterized protein n=1 Tax=Cyclocybe aegerita TaxID=1973307 RepID=A0A8S0WL24_CYCAE|nr:unnamed protein product [Cyclocybe aegerita]